MADRQRPSSRTPAPLALRPGPADRGARSVLGSAFGLGGRVARAGVDAAGMLLDSGRDLGSLASRRALATVDDLFIATVYAIVERLLAEDVVDHVLARVERSGVAQQIAERLLDDGIAEQIAQRVLSGPQAERLMATALGGPLMEEAVAQLLENQAVWVLVDEIARSPSVTDAISHQGTGFFEQVAEGARDRSRRADARVQRLAGRIRRRRESSSEKAPEADSSMPEPPLP